MTHHTATEAIATIGIDLGKNTFHLIGMDARGSVVLRRKIARGQLPSCLANLPVCLIGLEACAGAHHIGRQLAALGIPGRLEVPHFHLGPRQGEARRHVVRIKDSAVICFPLVVRGLNPEDSLKLQEAGLGGRRRMGCGIFISADKGEEP